MGFFITWHVWDPGPGPDTCHAQTLARMEESLLRLRWPRAPWYYHLHFPRGLLRRLQGSHQQNKHENAGSCLWTDGWSLVGHEETRRAAELGEWNHSAVWPHMCGHPASVNPHRRCEWALHPGLFLKIRWDVVYEASGTWRCLWVVFAWFTLKAWIWEALAWGGEGCSDGHFAWLRIFLGVGPQHSFHSQKPFMTPKAFKNHCSTIWFLTHSWKPLS